MRFEAHLREVRNKLLKVIAPLRQVLRRDWGLKRRATNEWMKGLLTPIELYVVWYKTWDNNRGIKLMNSVQRVALLASLRACRTVSPDAMQVLMGATPRYKAKRMIPMRNDILTTEGSGNDERSTRMLIDA